VEDSGTAITHGNHEYLPVLCKRAELDGPLRTMVAATGLAALSHSGNASSWRIEAYRLYGKAIRQLHSALSVDCQAKTDQTLAAIMLMGVFGVCVS